MQHMKMELFPIAFNTNIGDETATREFKRGRGKGIKYALNVLPKYVCSFINNCQEAEFFVGVDNSGKCSCIYTMYLNILKIKFSLV